MSAGTNGHPKAERNADEVDRVVAAWHRERPDLDLGPLEVLSRVARIARQLDRHRAAAFAEHGLDTWEFDVLAALRRAGGPYRLSPGQLAAETLVASGTMTNRIDRLQQRELVVRTPDPDDGRGVLVSLTEAGRTLVDAAMVTLLGRERAVLDALALDEAAELAALLRTLALGIEDRRVPR